MKLKDDGYDVEQLLKKFRYIDLSLDDYIFPISLLNSNVSDPTEKMCIRDRDMIVLLI